MGRPTWEGDVADDAHQILGGRYALLRRLGSGGMAEVWLAADRRLNDKPVAVKRLHGFRGGGDRSDDVERARREAFAVSQLSHPNLVAVTDFVVEDGEPVIVMEYVAGSTLEQLGEAGELSVDQIARIAGQIAAALDEAHSARIVHRDVKPANVMVTPRGDVKLADFGIARATEDPRMTKTGMFTGTVRYLAPELLDGAPATPASDMWSLGATLYELCEGRPAFAGDTTMAIVAAIAMTDPPPVVRHPELAPLIAALLERDPQARPTAAAVAANLDARRYTRPQAVPPYVPGPRVVTPGRGAQSGRDDETVIAKTPVAAPSPPRRTTTGPRTRPKRRARAYLLVAVPAVLAVAAASIAVGVRDRPGGIVAAQPDRTLSPSASPTASRSSHNVVVTSSPPQPAGVGGAEGPFSFGGVTVFGATDLDHAPDVVSRATSEPSGIRVRDVVVGKGAVATPDSTVRARYVAVLYRSGARFDSSWTRTPATIMLPDAITGLRIGLGGAGNVPAMHVGGRRIVIIPARLTRAGSAGKRSPRNSLVFVLDLVGVT